MNIRKAEIGDAEQLAELARETFDSTFSGHPKNAPMDMEAYMDKAFTAESFESEIADSNALWFICEIQSNWAGYLKLLFDSKEKCVVSSNPVELCRLYAHNDFQGIGVGKTLMLRALQEARIKEADTMWLGVWEFNHRAQEFYKKFGFQKCGEHVFLLGNDPQIDWVFSRDLRKTSD